jgi:hypothetical protein
MSTRKIKKPINKPINRPRRGENFDPILDGPIPDGKMKKILGGPILDGKMKKILGGEINTRVEKELLRYTQLDDKSKLQYSEKKLEDVFENMLEKTDSTHGNMANDNLKEALSNIRKLLYKMEIMLINNGEYGNLEEVEGRLIKSFVTLSEKVSPASAPAADAPDPAAPASDDDTNPPAANRAANRAAPAAAAKPIVAPAAAALSDTKPIVDPADDGPTGEAARHKSDEVRNAEKVIKAKAAEDAAEKAEEEKALNAALASPGWVPEEKSERN